jgi:hypothetical protein
VHGLFVGHLDHSDGVQCGACSHSDPTVIPQVIQACDAGIPESKEKSEGEKGKANKQKVPSSTLKKVTPRR